ncbi:hypothetical protein AgCh_026522 [Apium graveolens]
MFSINVSNDVVGNAIIANLKNESELWHLQAFVEKQSGRDIISLRTNKGGEFVFEEFNALCDEYVIRRDLTAPCTPEQNGVAERKNRMVVEMARTYALVNNRSKLDEKSEKYIFIGYCSKAYRLYNPVSGKVIISRNVVFDEEAHFKWNVKKNGSAYNIPVEGEADE